MRLYAPMACVSKPSADLATTHALAQVPTHTRRCLACICCLHAAIPLKALLSIHMPPARRSLFRPRMTSHIPSLSSQRWLSGA